MGLTSQRSAAERKALQPFMSLPVKYNHLTILIPFSSTWTIALQASAWQVHIKILSNCSEVFCLYHPYRWSASDSHHPLGDLDFPCISSNPFVPSLKFLVIDPSTNGKGFFLFTLSVPLISLYISVPSLRKTTPAFVISLHN